MLYAALTFWLLVIVFCAWAVHWLWSQLVKPRIVNTVLLPGTLVAQLGHVFGLLITGNSVSNTKLMGDDEAGEPTSDTPEKHRIPILGSVLVGLLPLVACAAGLIWAASTLGRGILMTDAAIELPQSLPLSLAAFWQLLRNIIDSTENVLNTIIHSDLRNWTNLLFIYLAICLTVRMTPFEGNRRGAIGAILLAGVVIGVLATLIAPVNDVVLSSWPVLSFAVAMLLFLLLFSLLVTGIVGLFRIMAKNE